jgi:hypothetical protein
VGCGSSHSYIASWRNRGLDSKPRLCGFEWDVFNEMNSISKRAQFYPPILGGKTLRPPSAGHVHRILKLLHYNGTSSMSIEGMGQEPNAKYQPPTGIISYLPRTWVPYAELMRLDRPGGFYALLFPVCSMCSMPQSRAPFRLLLPSLLTGRLLYFSAAFSHAEQHVPGMMLSTETSTSKRPGANLGRSRGGM